MTEPDTKPDRVSRRTVVKSGLLAAASAVIAPSGLAAAVERTASAQSRLRVVREGRELVVSGLAAFTGAVELRLYSDRNRSISKFSDVSPRAPSPEPPRRVRDAETWYPVVDVQPHPAMEGVALFDDVGSALYSVNGWARPGKQPLRPKLAIAEGMLEHWENAIWVEPAAPRLRAFYLRKRLEPGTDTLRFTLLADRWSGAVALHGASAELARVAVTQPPLAAPASSSRAAAATPGQAPDRGRVVDSLAAAVGYTLRSVNGNPASPTYRGLHMFYDLDASTYRSSHWIWGYGPSVRMLLDASKIPEVAARHPAKAMVDAAVGIGGAIARSADNGQLSGMPISRWERHSDYELGHRGAFTPADGGFLVGWAYVPLYEETKAERYLRGARRTVGVMEHLCREFSVTPQNLWMDQGTWGDLVIDESGFGTEGIAELYRVTGEEPYRTFGRLYMNQLLAKLERPDGLWERGWSRASGQRLATRRMTRGMGWAMEGLLAMHRMDPEGGWLPRARKMAEHLLAAQRPDGHWSFNFDQPSERVGVSEKGTALWSLLFYRLYAATKDERHLAAARRALVWCVDNQYAGPDPEAHGSHVAVSPHSGVGYRSWFRLSCAYTSGFFGLAALEELKLG